MPRPGTTVTIVDGAPPGGLPLTTGTAFAIGVTERGATTKAIKVRSLTEYQRIYGDRSGGSLLYDSVGAYFEEGGGAMYVSRVVGAGAAVAQVAFGTALTAKAGSPGAWGNSLTVESVAATAPQTGFVIIVKRSGTEVDRSPGLATAQDAYNWGLDRDYATFALTGAGTTPLAVIAPVTLTGGAAGSAPAAGDISAAIARFDYAFGPGQVLAPGYTDLTTQTAVLAHCDTNKRVALLDAPDTPTVATLISAASTLYTKAGARMGSLWAPWIQYPGPSGATVTIPPSAVEAGIIARSDVRSLNPNQPAAGVNGLARRALGLSQTYVDADREALNEAGVDLFKPLYGDIRAYGFRTAAGPNETNWLWFSNSRVVMAIAYEADAAAENYVLRQIDGQGHLFAALEADLNGVCLRYFNRGALYGEISEEAYDVDTGSGVNTIETIQAGEIHAVIRLKASPAGEWVEIQVVKVQIDTPLAAAAA